MNATDLGIFRFLWGASARRTNAPAAPRPAAGPRPGGQVEPLPPVAPARPVTGLPAEVRARILHCLTEYGSCCRDETKAERLDHGSDAAAARNLQRTYAAEIAALLEGETR